MDLNKLSLAEGICLPDYTHSIVNLTSTVLDYFHVTPSHPTLPMVDEILKAHPFKNVIVFVCDGMGTYNLKLALPKTSFLRQNLKDCLTSVFPPTTVAATTALESGLTPKENGWVGWSAYFKEIDSNVNVFINTDDHGKPAADYSVVNRYVPYTQVYERITQAGFGTGNSVSRFGTLYTETLPEIYETLLRQCKEPGPQYLYCYWPEPDHTMHERGVTDPQSLEWIRTLNDQLEELSHQLKDTLLIITADHGHIDTKNLALSDIPGLADTLRHLPSIEPRTLSCFLKEGKEEEFLRIYEKYLSGKFLLLSHDEAVNSELFGTGGAHPRFSDFIGDYLLVAVSEYCLFNSAEERDFFIGAHAGFLPEEMHVPLIIRECF